MMNSRNGRTASSVPQRPAAPGAWLRPANLLRRRELLAWAALVPAAALGRRDDGDDDNAAWAALRSAGHVALVRHAEAPGVGDPPGFRLDDCATQRNLSPTGREQARSLGVRLRRHRIESAVVLSSPWCRCLETARLLEVGPVVADAALGSFFGIGADAPRRTAELRRRLAEVAASSRSRILVTHHANIGALTGVYPASGEVVVVRMTSDAPSVVGRLR